MYQIYACVWLCFGPKPYIRRLTIVLLLSLPERHIYFLWRLVKKNSSILLDCISWDTSQWFCKQFTFICKQSNTNSSIFFRSFCVVLFSVWLDIFLFFFLFCQRDIYVIAARTAAVPWLIHRFTYRLKHIHPHKQNKQIKYRILWWKWQNKHQKIILSKVSKASCLLIKLTRCK